MLEVSGHGGLAGDSGDAIPLSNFRPDDLTEEQCLVVNYLEQ